MFMKKFILFILFAIIFFPSSNFGCTCLPPPTFCDGLTGSNGEILPDVILRGKLIGYPSSSEIKVSHTIYGTINQSQIKLGFTMCTAFTDQLEDGKEFIFSLKEINDKFVPIGCNIFLLKIENEVVKGKIAPGVESINYADLGDLETCGIAFESFNFEKNISLFPNPTEGEVTIKNIGVNILFENLELTVYDMLGKKVTVFEKPEGILPDEFWNFNIQNLSAGVYIFNLSGINQESYIRIVKQ